MKHTLFVVAAMIPTAAQGQAGPCFWAEQLLTCNQQSQAQAEADVFVARSVTGPAPASAPDFSPDGVNNYSRGVHDAMVNGSAGRLKPEALSVSTEVVRFGSQNVFKTRLFAPSQVFMYQFAGVSGPDRIVVGCISRTARPFETRGTECERQANSAFAH